MKYQKSYYLMNYDNYMANYAVLGLGMMGEAICFDILNHDKGATVYGYEINEMRRQEVEDKLSEFSQRFITVEFYLDDTQPIEGSNLLNRFKNQQINVVFGAIDYKFNVYLSKVCIEAGAHFLDLGGNPDIVNQQRALSNLSKNAGITIIPDCGLAPGMVNVLAASIMNEFDNLDYCKIRVGGLPRDPKTILNYQQVFSIRGLTNEYLEDAEVIRDGVISKVSSLTEIETMSFELFNYDEFEAFQTAGGTSSLPQIFEGKIKNLDYKTIRYKGHGQFIQFLKEFELLSSKSYKDTNINPREVVEYYLQKHLPKNNPDLVFIKIEVVGTIDAKAFRKILEIVDEHDEKTHLSAMARTTAFPISIIGQMISNGIINKRGVVPGETSVPFDKFKDELAKREIIIKSETYEI